MSLSRSRDGLYRGAYLLRTIFAEREDADGMGKDSYRWRKRGDCPGWLRGKGYLEDWRQVSPCMVMNWELDPEGKEIPIYAVPSAARLAVSFSPLKGEFIGKDTLRRQFEEVNRREGGDPLPPKEKRLVPRGFSLLRITGQGSRDKVMKSFWRMENLRDM